MTTLMLKQENYAFVPLSATFVDEYMPAARGEYVKVYIMLVRYMQTGEIGVTTSFLSDTLGLLETDVLKALEYWHQKGLISMKTIDAAGNLSIQLNSQIESKGPAVPSAKTETAQEYSDGMLMEIESMMGRPLSTREMDTFLSFKSEYSFPGEVVMLLVQHCLNRGVSDLRYMEKVAINWHSLGINTVALAQSNIRKHEDKWSNYRKVLTYLGMKEAEIMKPQEDLLDKWFNTYSFSTEMILKACDISFNNLGKGELKYIDAILRSWNEENIKTPEEVDSRKKPPKAKGKPGRKDTSDFTEREYDYSELEKKLLGRE